MSPTPTRKLWIAAAVVGVVVLTGGAWYLGQQQGSTPAPTAASSTTPAGIPAGGALPMGTVVAGEGGTTTGPGGVPMGHTHDDQGAVAAATNLSCAAWTRPMLKKSTREDFIAAASTSAYRPQFAAGVNSIYRFWLRRYPDLSCQPERGAYAIESSTPDRVRVLLWTPIHFPGKDDEIVPDGSLWLVSYATLEWVDGDWKISDWNDRTTQGAYLPAPAEPGSNPSPTEKAAILTTEANYDLDTDEPAVIKWWAAPWQEYANAAR